jgi:hypothetical protein
VLKPITCTCALIFTMLLIGFYERHGNENYYNVLYGSILSVAVCVLWYGYKSTVLPARVVNLLGIFFLFAVAIGAVNSAPDTKSIFAGSSLGLIVGHVVSFLIYRPHSYKYAAMAAKLDGYDKLERYFKEKFEK